MLVTLREYYPTMFNDALAKLLKVSVRSLQRKAKELGLEKVKDFNKVRAEDISRRLSDALKRSYAENGHPCAFQKGVRNNPEGEFQKGHRFPDEIENERKDKIRRKFKRRKLLQIYGLKMI
jgi:hypothetical protein